MTITAVRVSCGNIAANVLFYSGAFGLVNAVPSRKAKVWRSRGNFAVWAAHKVIRRETSVPLAARRNIKTQIKSK